MLHVDSPGGHVAGVQALADTIFQARKLKPLHAHIEDLGASAAYWLASQANTVTANSTAEVGSIGTMAVVHDSSGAAAKAGIKVYVVSSAPAAGIGSWQVDIHYDASALSLLDCDGFAWLCNEVSPGVVRALGATAGGVSPHPQRRVGYRRKARYEHRASVVHDKQCVFHRLQEWE